VQYSQLSKQARRFINPVGLPEQLRFATKTHYFIKAFAFLGLLPLCASIVMALTLEGGEQTFYQVVVALLLPAVVICWLLKHYLVLDNASQQRFVQLQCLAYHFKREQAAPLAATELLLRHSSYDRRQYMMKLHDVTYATGNLDETSALVLFIAKKFNLKATEQVTDFPNIHALAAHSAVEPQLSSALQLAPAVNLSDSGKASVENSGKDNLKVSDQHKASSPPIEQLWHGKIAIRFLYPLPVILLCGLVMKFIGGL
jgi:hypothetical protein